MHTFTEHISQSTHMHTCTDPKRRAYRAAQSLSSRTHTDKISQKSAPSSPCTVDLVQFGSELITEKHCQFHILAPAAAFALATQDTTFPMFPMSNDQGADFSNVGLCTS